MVALLHKLDLLIIFRVLMMSLFPFLLGLVVLHVRHLRNFSGRDVAIIVLVRGFEQGLQVRLTLWIPDEAGELVRLPHGLSLAIFQPSRVLRMLQQLVPGQLAVLVGISLPHHEVDGLLLHALLRFDRFGTVSKLLDQGGWFNVLGGIHDLLSVRGGLEAFGSLHRGGAAHVRLLALSRFGIVATAAAAAVAQADGHGRGWGRDDDEEEEQGEREGEGGLQSSQHLRVCVGGCKGRVYNLQDANLLVADLNLCL
mmetsp:Transcript_18931/g.40717  ORF Transcript_18931/g.40717 Transcript_18931/m.40717 type:complete len:254 (+) Transcript_18931:85-846(+)